MKYKLRKLYLYPDEVVEKMSLTHFVESHEKLIKDYLKKQVELDNQAPHDWRGNYLKDKLIKQYALKIHRGLTFLEADKEMCDEHALEDAKIIREAYLEKKAKNEINIDEIIREDSKDYKCYVYTGGNNGPYDWEKYFHQCEFLIKKLKQYFKEVIVLDLINGNNDTFTLRVMCKGMKKPYAELGAETLLETQN